MILSSHFQVWFILCIGRTGYVPCDEKVPLPASRKKDPLKRSALSDKTERALLMQPKDAFSDVLYRFHCIAADAVKYKSRIFQKSKIRAVKQPIRTYSDAFSMSGRQKSCYSIVRIIRYSCKSLPSFRQMALGRTPAMRNPIFSYRCLARSLPSINSSSICRIPPCRCAIPIIS